MAKASPSRIVVALLAVCIVGAVIWSFWPNPIPVETASATRGTFVATVDEDGKTRVRERFVVASPLAGRTTRVELDAGDHVKAGDVIASILPSPAPFLDPRARREAEERLGAAEAALDRAKATMERANVVLNQAGRDLSRARALLERGVSTVKAVEQAELAHHVADRDVSAANFQYHAAQHAVEQAKALLALYDRSTGTPPESFEVVAPVAGEIIRVLQESETIVQPGTPLVEIGDCCNLEIVVDVLSTDAVEIEKGDRVIIEHWGGPKPLEGQVRTVEPGGFTKISTLGVEEQRANVIIDIVSPRKAWLDLGDAYQIDARIEVLAIDDALIVPSGALFRQGKEWNTYVVRDGRAELRPVEVLRRSGGVAALSAGLEPGEQVIVYPSDSIAPGVRVVPR
ncbi:efflux RND transporter periplasmic adaptor subunit [Methyloceanibacter sp.]|uniref:efflux RND transporter periplasmic adaptor subunit n=1 Tax=Methyloceanibacter sp. TaxID=1965321 RepID=UPI003567A0E0